MTRSSSEFDLPVRIGGHLLEEFDSELTRVEHRRLSYLQKMATVMSRRVWENAGSPEVDTNRLMVSVGTGMGSCEELIYAYEEMRAGGMKGVNPLGVQMYMPNGAAAAVGLERHAKAGVITSVSACASGSEGIAHAWQQIVLGEADVAICGGVETRIEAVPIASFAADAHRVVQEQRRPGRRVQAVRQGPRRLRLRRGRRVDGDRDRGARQGARGQHPGPADGGKHHLRRVPHRGAGPRRRCAPGTPSRGPSSSPA